MTIIHIGAPKSGSTSLQRGLFSSLREYTSFGEYGDGSTSLEDYEVIRKCLSTESDFLSEETRIKMDKVLARKRQLATERQLIFSSADILEFQRPTALAKLFSDFFGQNSQILLVVRKQKSALVSYYVAHGAWLKNVPKPYFRKHVNFQDWLDFQFYQERGSQLFTFSYWKQLSPFIDTFGRKNIHVVSFEGLISGDRISWEKIGSLINESPETCMRAFFKFHERQRPSNLRFIIGRFMGFIPSSIKTRKRLSDIRLPDSVEKWFREFDPKIDKSTDQKIANYFKYDNIELDKEFNLNLKNYGYFEN